MCEHRFTKTLEYAPPSMEHPNDLLVTHDRSRERLSACASLWLQNWLCGLPSGPQDLSGITVGKTILTRVMKTYAATLDPRRPPQRPTFSREHLKRWPWRPQRSSSGGNGGACASEEAWITSDVCAPGGGGGFGGFGRSAIATLGALDASLVREGAAVVRSAVAVTAPSGGD